MSSILDRVKAATKDLPNQADPSTGFERSIPPEGPTPARFVGYIELGKRKQKPYQGKERDDAAEVRLVFELNGTKHRNKVTVDGEEKTFTNQISAKTTVKINTRASFYKLFEKMRYGRENITHMAQMLGEGFLLRVVHNDVEDSKGQKKTYASIRDSDGSWLVGAPMQEDAIAGTSTPIPVPEATQDIRVLLWDNPSKEQWDTLFIDGTRTQKNAKGEEVEVSKNWMQEDILQNATNFPGSPLEAMLADLGDLGSLVDTPAETPEEEAAAVLGGSTPSDGATPQTDATAAPAPADDPLAAMGL